MPDRRAIEARPCRCGHPAKEHLDYAFACERCACPAFDAAPKIERRWVQAPPLIAVPGRHDPEI